MPDNSYFWFMITFDAVLMFMHGCLYLVERKRYILLWCCSRLFFMLSSITLSIMANTEGNYTEYVVIQSIFNVLAFMSIAKGAVEFFRGKAPKLFLTVTAAIGIYYVIIYFLKLHEFFSYIPQSIYGGFLLIYTGIVSIKTVYIKSITRYILGISFILWGINSILLPVYIYNSSTFSVTPNLLQIFPLATIISLQMVYFQHSREKQLSIDKKMKYLIAYDTLTGLYNRGYIEIEMERINTADYLPISIIMGDLNGLKLINDTFGHKKGDQLLAEAAKIMKEAAPNRIIGRWGGDEFIILLTKTDLDKAMEILDIIKDKCAAYKEGNIPLDISLGAATKKYPGQSFEDTIAMADIMLYKNKLTESRQIRKSIVDYLKDLLLKKNIETEEHVNRMKKMAYMLALDMNLPLKEREDVVLAAFLHDIGKISIPDSILNKPDTLTPEEWEIMRKHSEIGYRITLASEEFAHISQAVLSHHERWDGKGYPQNLKGKDIPLIARIISVIDTFDAMTNNRVYKEAMSKEEALAVIEAGAGKHFDPEISKRFVNLMRRFSTDQLSTEYDKPERVLQNCSYI